MEAVLRLPRALRAVVLLASCAAQEKPAELRVPLSVLDGDDPCAGGECSAALLQRSSDGFRASQRLKAPEAVEAAPPGQSPPAERPAPAAAAAPAANATAAAPAAADAAPVAPVAASVLQKEQHQRSAAQEKRAAPTSLLADIRHLVTKVKVSGRTAPEVRHLAEEYAQLLEAQAVPSLTAGYKEHQGLLASHAQSFSRCDTDLAARLETERQLRKVYEGWQAMHRDCRSHEARLQKELAACNHRLNVTSARKQAACLARNVSKPAAGKRNDTSLVQLKRQCQEATQGYVDQWSICAEGERFYDTKRSECDSVQQSMETANCTRASQVSGVCDMYDLCRAGMSLAYASAKEAARAWERYHQAEWLAVVMVRCFAENLGSEAENSTALLGELEKCEQLVTNTTLFDLEYPDVPSPLPCTPVSDSPCVARAPQPSASSRKSPPSTMPLASAVAADEQKNGLPTAVSFMQEGIERASVALPREVHEALFRPFAAPTAMLLVAITGLVALGRCMLHQREKGQDVADGGKRKVDKWCIPSSETFGAAGPPHSTHLMLDGGRWLCPELLVPKNSKCTIAVPVVSGLRLDAAPANFMVIDKMGQPLFKASATRVPREPDAGAATDGGLVEQLAITRQDGTTLATCQWEVPQAGAARLPECRLCQRDGLLFATMKRDSCQVSWLSRFLKRRASTDAACGFEFGSASPGAWQLRVQGSVNESKFSFVDGASRVMAVVERGPSLGFEQRGQEFYRLEVGSEADVDLGLVTIVLLTIDRLRGSLVPSGH